jgi:hypothetical protein
MNYVLTQQVNLICLSLHRNELIITVLLVEVLMPNSST